MVELVKLKNNVLLDLQAARSQGDQARIQSLALQGAQLEEEIADALISSGSNEQAVVNLISQASCLLDAGKKDAANAALDKAMQHTHQAGLRAFIKGMQIDHGSPAETRLPGRRTRRPVTRSTHDWRLHAPSSESRYGDPLSLTRRPRRRSALGRHDARPLNSGEHVWVGTAGAQVACTIHDVDSAMFTSIKRQQTDDRLSYGELVALSGDFYMSPSDLFEEQPAALPWMYEPMDLSDLHDVFRAELAWTGGNRPGEYPDFSVRMALNAKSFAEFAIANTDHFGWHNMVAYCRYHSAALELARRAGGSNDECWARARFYNAFADHFLADGFAAGHVRVPRAQLRAWALGRGYSDKLAGALSKLVHDQDGHNDSLHADHHMPAGKDGLRVMNAKGEDWLVRCDGQLFLPEGSVTSLGVKIPIAAVAASVSELLQVWRGDKLPEGHYAATEFVAFTHPAEKSLEEKFSAAAWPRKRLGALMDSVKWYSKIPWIGPGMGTKEVLELFKALPALMQQFRLAVQIDLELNPALGQRLAPAYVAAYRAIR